MMSPNNRLSVKYYRNETINFNSQVVLGEKMNTSNQKSKLFCPKKRNCDRKSEFCSKNRKCDTKSELCSKNPSCDKKIRILFKKAKL